MVVVGMSAQRDRAKVLGGDGVRSDEGTKCQSIKQALVKRQWASQHLEGAENRDMGKWQGAWG